jgi:AbrB family looped-hinge helix DNA binding protein
MSGYVVKVIEINGQSCVPIPKEICDELGIKEGTKVSVDVSPDGKSIIIKKV